jgi:hypothetical protein
VELSRVEPPRVFGVGDVRLAHVADARLEPDELVTFKTAVTELDVVRKAWGYYATSSNRRLREHGLRLVLCAHDDGRISPLLVEASAEAEFERYVAEQPLRVLAWLDTEEAAADAIRRLEGA